MTAPRRVTWKRLGSAAVALACVGFLAYKAYTGWDALRSFDWHIRAAYLPASFGLYLLQFLIIVWGWQSIMNSLVEPLPFVSHLRIYGYTHILQRIPAGMLVTIAGRVQAYRQHNVTTGQSAVASSLEFLVTILTGLPLAALAAVALGRLAPAAGLPLAAATLALEVAALHPDLLDRLLRRVRGQSLHARLAYRHTLAWAGVYTLIWLVSGAGLWLLANAFAPLPAAQLPQTIAVWVLSSLVAFVTVLSPSGLGVKELSMTVLLGLLLSDPLPLLVPLAIRAAWTAYDLVVAAAAWLVPQRTSGLPAGQDTPNG